MSLKSQSPDSLEMLMPYNQVLGCFPNGNFQANEIVYSERDYPNNIKLF